MTVHVGQTVVTFLIYGKKRSQKSQSKAASKGLVLMRTMRMMTTAPAPYNHPKTLNNLSLTTPVNNPTILNVNFVCLFVALKTRTGRTYGTIYPWGREVAICTGTVPYRTVPYGTVSVLYDGTVITLRYGTVPYGTIT